MFGQHPRALRWTGNPHGSPKQTEVRAEEVGYTNVHKYKYIYLFVYLSLLVCSNYVAIFILIWHNTHVYVYYKSWYVCCNLVETSRCWSMPSQAMDERTGCITTSMLELPPTTRIITCLYIFSTASRTKPVYAAVSGWGGRSNLCLLVIHIAMLLFVHVSFIKQLASGNLPKFG